MSQSKKSPIPVNPEEIDAALAAELVTRLKLELDIQMGKSRNTAGLAASKRRIAQLLTKRKELERRK